MEARSDQAENRNPAGLEWKLEAWPSGSGIESALMARGLSGRTACRDPELSNRPAEVSASVGYDEVENQTRYSSRIPSSGEILRIDASAIP